MQEKEIWKDVIGFEGLYQVSNLGNLISLDRTVACKHGGKLSFNGVLKSTRLCGSGYLVSDLYKNGVQNTVMIHRLKAIAFIANPENKKTVNHRDGIKTNNGYNEDGDDNLEWATSSENNNHAINTNLRKTKPVIQLSMRGDFISRFESGADAVANTGTRASGISKCINGHLSMCNGFRWISAD